MLCVRGGGKEEASKRLEAQNLAAKSGNRPRFKCTDAACCCCCCCCGREKLFEGDNKSELVEGQSNYRNCNCRFCNCNAQESGRTAQKVNCRQRQQLLAANTQASRGEGDQDKDKDIENENEKEKENVEIRMKGLTRKMHRNKLLLHKRQFMHSNINKKSDYLILLVCSALVATILVSNSSVNCDQQNFHANNHEQHNHPHPQPHHHHHHPPHNHLHVRHPIGNHHHHHYHHRHDHHHYSEQNLASDLLLSATTTKIDDNILKVQDSNHFLKIKRARRHLIDSSTINITQNDREKTQQRKEKGKFFDSAKNAMDYDSLKVAALAAKLEQWFACHRFISTSNLLAEELPLQTPANDGAGGGSNEQLGPPTTNYNNLILENGICQSHFDGHLCWPESKANQLVRLPCPQTNLLLLLPGQQQQEQQTNQEQASGGGGGTNTQHSSAKSVINSIEINLDGESERQNKSAFQKSIKIEQNKPTSVDSATTTTTTGRGLAASKYAYRDCQSLDHKPTHNNQTSAQLISNKETIGLVGEAVGEQSDPLGSQVKSAQWQLEADYSECTVSDSSRMEDKTLAVAAGGYYFDLEDKWINLNTEQDRRLFSSLIGELERIEGAIDPYSDPDLLEQWTLCIRNIMRAQANSASTVVSQSRQQESSGAWCPIIFDGWRCWPSTRAGDVAYVSCPSNQPGFSAERKAHKICTTNGTWYKHPMTNRYWSNYTTCVDTVDLAFRRRILNLYIIGNLISLVALSASLIIFISFKSLKCTRVTIHKNLFLSFITNNLMWIIWYTYVVNDANLLKSNPVKYTPNLTNVLEVICQFWHILLHYFLVSNYFWMFCEGLYLHTLLVVAFVSEDKILKWFYMMGWITPIPITVAYAYHRSYDVYYTNFCWMEESPYNLILMAPIGISLLLNLIFLINIVRVLVTKLRANNSPDTHQTRKAVRATLILIPLLGLHYILTPFRPETKSEWEGIYETVAAVCTSFQGLCVAMLFCFCNGEVITVIKKKLKDTFNAKGKRNNNNVRYSNSNSNNNFNQTNNNNNNNYNNNNFEARNSFNPNTQNGNNHLKTGNTLNSLISTSSFPVNGENFSNSQLQLQQQQQQQQLLHTTATLLHEKPFNVANSNNSNSSSLMTTVTGSPVQLTRGHHHQQVLQLLETSLVAPSSERKLSSVSQFSNTSTQQDDQLLVSDGAVLNFTTNAERQQTKSLLAPSVGLELTSHLKGQEEQEEHDEDQESDNLLQKHKVEQKLNTIHSVTTLQSSPLQTTTTSFSIA